MNSIISQTSLTASEARQNLYQLIKSTSQNLRSYEINLRGSKPVVLISREELDGWLETLDIMSHPEEVESIELAKKEKGRVGHRQMLKAIGLTDEA